MKKFISLYSLKGMEWKHCFKYWDCSLISGFTMNNWNFLTWSDSLGSSGLTLSFYMLWNRSPEKYSCLCSWVTSQQSLDKNIDFLIIIIICSYYILIRYTSNQYFMLSSQQPSPVLLNLPKTDFSLWHFSVLYILNKSELSLTQILEWSYHALAWTLRTPTIWPNPLYLTHMSLHISYFSSEVIFINVSWNLALSLPTWNHLDPLQNNPQ